MLFARDRAAVVAGLRAPVEEGVSSRREGVRGKGVALPWVLGPGWLRTCPSAARGRTERPRGPSNLRSGTRGAVGGGRRHGGRRCDGKGLREILPCGQPTGERGTAQNRRCELQAAVANSGFRRRAITKESTLCIVRGTPHLRPLLCISGS